MSIDAHTGYYCHGCDHIGGPDGASRVVNFRDHIFVDKEGGSTLGESIFPRKLQFLCSTCLHQAVEDGRLLVAQTYGPPREPQAFDHVEHDAEYMCYGCNTVLEHVGMLPGNQHSLEYLCRGCLMDAVTDGRLLVSLPKAVGGHLITSGDQFTCKRCGNTGHTIVAEVAPNEWYCEHCLFEMVQEEDLQLSYQGSEPFGFREVKRYACYGIGDHTRDRDRVAHVRHGLPDVLRFMCSRHLQVAVIEGQLVVVTGDEKPAAPTGPTAKVDEDGTVALEGTTFRW